MSPPPIDNRSARLAVIGAESVNGIALRSILEKRRVPGDRVDLFGRTGGEAVISEYDGEARLIQDPESTEMKAADVIFICEPGALCDRIHENRVVENLVLDLTGTIRGCGTDSLIHSELLPARHDQAIGVWTVPHYLSIAMSRLIAPLAVDAGLNFVAATVLRPAADFGKPGVEELRLQTVNLLNFLKVPKELFPRQLAFNCIPQHLMPEEPELDTRISTEVETLCGLPADSVSLGLVAVPIFFGHAVHMTITLEPGTESDQVAALLAGAVGVALVDDGSIGTVLEVNEQQKIVVSRIGTAGDGRFRIWAVIDGAGSLAADEALRVADAMCQL